VKSSSAMGAPGTWTSVSDDHGLRGFQSKEPANVETRVAASSLASRMTSSRAASA
jgi:hypothetical protein